MGYLTTIHPKNGVNLRWFVVILLVNLILLTRAAWYSNIEPVSRRVDVYTDYHNSPAADRNVRCNVTNRQNCDREISPTGPSSCVPGSLTFCIDQRAVIHPPFAKSTSSVGQATTLTPFLDIVPSQDGTELFVSAGGVGELGGTTFLNLGSGPGHDRGGWTMTYSNTIQAYVATATGFSPNTGTYGPLSITTTLGLDTGTVDFYRAYVPASTAQTIDSQDGNLQLQLVSTDTIKFNTYVAVIPSFGPPGPIPQGHRLVGSAYSVRAAGALVVTDKPMILRLHYSDATLAGADPHTLAIFSWDAASEQWVYLGGRLFYDQDYLSVATDRFTTYALMATPAWHDEFNDVKGLTVENNVILGGTIENRTLVLLNYPGNGTAVSKPITPLDSLANWGTLTFTGTSDPPTTTLTVDVLSLDGTEVLTDVASGTSLAGVDPAQYPSLKLRLNLSSTTGGETPALDQWQISWQASEEQKVYLPIVLK